MRHAINVPDHVEDEAVYIAAAQRRIAANAAKGARKRFESENPDHEKIRNWLYDSAARSAFARSLFEQLDTRGGLSPKQVALVRKYITEGDARKQAQRAADLASTYVHNVGDRREFSLQVAFVTSYDSAYGTMHVVGMKDAAGNVLIYKGGKCFGCQRGDGVTFTATIKEHKEREGVKQTILARPANVEVTRL